MDKLNKTVAIIGAGPAGLMAAEMLIGSGLMVNIYDAMPTAGRKFLMAGKGGLNITHAEPYSDFLSQYGSNRINLEPIINLFPPDAIRNWIHGLGIPTFIGSSGRIFPIEMKAAPLLRAWLHKLRVAGIKFNMRHRWLGWSKDNELYFEVDNQACIIKADAVLLALGGGSWPHLGATGEWQKILAERNIIMSPLKPANCGFNITWSDFFRQNFSGQALKPVQLTVVRPDGVKLLKRGELMVTDYGIEGGVIYSLSRDIRQNIERLGPTTVALDLTPDLDLMTIQSRLTRPRGKASVSHYLRKSLGISSIKVAILRENLAQIEMYDAKQVASLIKAFPLILNSPRPLSEAISSAGGIDFAGLNEQLMLNAMPGVFCAGEMLDWEAPTGGYLLTACLATGRAAGLGIKAWLAET